MKKQLFILATLSLLILAACQPAPEQPAEQPAPDAPNYALFNEKVSVIKSFIKAHSDEDIEAIGSLMADTMKYSPPNYNGNEWLGKEELISTLAGYHQEFDNITFHEGLAGLDDEANAANAFWSGSVFPEGTGTMIPSIIRGYGTWTAVHSESGKEVGVKWYALIWVNEAGQITRFTDYFDVNGIAAQLAAE
jgi:hypothetical protein